MWVLREAYAAGRLELGELRARAGAAWAARTWRELRALTADLPTPPGLTGQTGTCSPPGPRTPVLPPGPRTPVLPLATLVCLVLAAAAWQPAAVLPLIILIVPVLAVALLPPAARTPRGGVADHRRRPDVISGRHLPAPGRASERT